MAEDSITTPYARVLDVVASASEEVVLVAPFIKSATLKRILAAIKNGQKSVTCVTRWLPIDIATGVCDLQIYDLLRTEGKGTLLVHPHLHAKYYRGDDRCLLGSANLSGRGLGSATPSNVEILVEVPFEFEKLRAWETRLIGSSIAATSELRDELAQAAEKLAAEGTSVPTLDPNAIDTQQLATKQWVPTCPVPHCLWDVYSGKAEASLTKTGLETAQSDLADLAVPKGLGQRLFAQYVASTLKEMPLISEIDALASEGLLDEQAIGLIEARLGDDAPYSATQSWRVIKDWLVFFFGSTYRLEVGQEVLVKGREIPRT